MDLKELLMSIAEWFRATRELDGIDISYRDDDEPYVGVTLRSGERFARGEVSLAKVALNRWNGADVDHFLRHVHGALPPVRSFKDSKV